MIGAFIHTAAEHQKEVAVGVELLHAVVAHIGHIYGAVWCHGDPAHAEIRFELPRPRSHQPRPADRARRHCLRATALQFARPGGDSPTPGLEELPEGREDADAGVAAVEYVGIAGDWAGGDAFDVVH